MTPLLDKHGELFYVNDNGVRMIIHTLKHQYRSERELVVLLGIIGTLERVGLMHAE